MTSARRSDPFREMEDLQDRMGQLMDGLFGLVPPTIAARLPLAPADIEETDDAYVVELDLPGVKPGDVDVEVRENELRVSGQIKEKERKGILRRQMRRVGQFEHVVALPGRSIPTRSRRRCLTACSRCVSALAPLPPRLSTKECEDWLGRT